MKKILASLALTLGASLFGATASASIVVTFTPSAQHVNVGDQVAVDVEISGLGDEILSSFDLNFFYNGAVIGSWRLIAGATAYDQLGQGYACPPFDPCTPLWDFDVFSLGEWGIQASALADDETVAANQANSFLLFHFEFTADADGVSLFTLGPDLDFQRNFVGRRSQSLDVEIGSACIAVGTGNCAVPEPGTLSLMALALVGLAGLRARRPA